jgi:glutaredoxin-like protein
MSEKIIMYATNWCSDCKRAKMLLDTKGVDYKFIDISDNREAIEYVERVNNGMRSVPTIVFPKGKILVEPSNEELLEELENSNF